MPPLSKRDLPTSFADWHWFSPDWLRHSGQSNVSFLETMLSPHPGCIVSVWFKKNNSNGSYKTSSNWQFSFFFFLMRCIFNEKVQIHFSWCVRFTDWALWTCMPSTVEICFVGLIRSARKSEKESGVTLSPARSRCRAARVFCDLCKLWWRAIKKWRRCF